MRFPVVVVLAAIVVVGALCAGFANATLDLSPLSLLASPSDPTSAQFAAYTKHFPKCARDGLIFSSSSLSPSIFG